MALSRDTSVSQYEGDFALIRPANTSGGKVSDFLIDPDPGNTWDTIRPFFELPAWWRKFIFRMLTPREFTVYCYIVSYCGRAKVARPLIRHMMADLNLVNSNQIHIAIKKLVDRGFLIKSQEIIHTRQTNVYKRPSLEHTLMKLLDEKLIDGNLMPTTGKKNAVKGDDYKRALKPVSEGLRLLLGDDRHSEWLKTADLNRADLLRLLLEERLSDRITDFKAKRGSKPPQTLAHATTEPLTSEDRDHPQYDFFFEPDGTPRLIPGEGTSNLETEDDFDMGDHEIPF